MAAEAAAGVSGGAGESPAQPAGGRGSLVTALSSMWSALVLGILAAIFAWFWFGSSGESSEAKEPRAGEDEETATGCRLENQLSGHEAKESSLSSREEQVLEGTATRENLTNIPVAERSQEPGISDETCLLAGGARANSLQDANTPLVREAKGQGIAEENVNKLTLTCTDNQLAEIKGSLNQPQGRDPVDNLEKEMYHLAGVNSNVHESFTFNLKEEFDYCPSNLSTEEAGKLGLVETEARIPEGDAKIKQVAAVSPMPQNVHVKFRVHYVTYSDLQLIAVTGDHKDLGAWETYIPLKSDKDGFWSESVVLPADTRVAWKFVMVENGKIKCWEECSNRSLETGHEDKEAHQCWGYH